MYNLIIGYNQSSINLIKFLIAKGEIVFLIDNKTLEEIQIRNKAFYYYKTDIKDMNQVLAKATKNMLSKVFIVTENDYLNLMIEETLKELENVQAIYNASSLEKLTAHGSKNFFLEKFFEKLVEGGN